MSDRPLALPKRNRKAVAALSAVRAAATLAAGAPSRPVAVGVAHSDAPVAPVPARAEVSGERPAAAPPRAVALLPSPSVARRPLPTPVGEPRLLPVSSDAEPQPQPRPRPEPESEPKPEPEPEPTPEVGGEHEPAVVITKAEKAAAKAKAKAIKQAALAHKKEEKRRAKEESKAAKVSARHASAD